MVAVGPSFKQCPNTWLSSTQPQTPTRLFVRLGAGSAVRFLRSILIPGDETSLHLVEAEFAGALAEAFAQAGLAANRVVEAVNVQVPTTVDKKRRKNDNIKAVFGWRGRSWRSSR